MLIPASKNLTKGSQWIKRQLGPRAVDWMRPVLHDGSARIARLTFGSNLSELAMFFGTDKLEHGYTGHYQTHFGHLRQNRLNLLEIGIGGYENPRLGGESLKMWKAFFPHAVIHGLDIHDKAPLAESRIKIWRGSQTDEALLRSIASVPGGLDIVIDDGSHRSEHVIATFQILFPLLKDGGVYAIEDTQTSYWPEYGGLVGRDSGQQTTMGFFKALSDGLNYEEFKDIEYVPTYTDRHIVAMHFYHNLIVLQKGHNSSNGVPQNNRAMS